MKDQVTQSLVTEDGMQDWVKGQRSKSRGVDITHAHTLTLTFLRVEGNDRSMSRASKSVISSHC